ncbi:MAG: hypothetical protein GY928_16550 [Colwellia sp.]|nr:hypothetical protein [Colwellia sp.]
MFDLYICNIDTGEEVKEFKGVTDIKEGVIEGSVLLETDKKNYVIKLRECDFIEIFK